MTLKNTNPNQNNSQQESPKWNWTTKLIVGLALVAMAAWLLVQFQEFLGPLITSVLLGYLLYPIANFLQSKFKIPWRLAVTLIYLVLVLAIVGLLTWGGFAIVEQIQNVIRFIEKNIDQIPDLVENITSQTFQIGPFTFEPSGFNWDEIANQIVGTIQPILGQLGSFASSIAAGAVSIITWLILILLVSYFLLAESEGIPGQLLNIQMPIYKQDLERMGMKLDRIWNGFIRGEFLVVLFSLLIYTIALGILGVQFFFGLAVIAAIGQLIPYVGAWATWISFGLVALFQSNTPFGMPPGFYMLLVLGVSMVVNNVIDNIVRIKVMSNSLKVHPALVLIGALVGVQLLGFVGIIIAAPVMASLRLFLNYAIKKLSDQDPWKSLDVQENLEPSKWIKFLMEQWHKFSIWSIRKFSFLWKKMQPKKPASQDSETDSSEKPKSKP